ncbi:MAG: extracellular solute-binding protein [Thermoleophilia bacterium]|nr:extracellular solute-binding protein [Thermoleophilia bacterium]
MSRKQVATAIVAVGLAALGASVASSSPNKGAAAGGKLEVFSWWTSGSENAALQQLFKATKQANPEIQIVNAAVAGGAGTNAKQVLATRLGGGDIPETWQTHPGGELADYVAQGVLEPLDSLYAVNGWRKTVPAALIKSMTYNGHIYAVLVNTHRANVVWYNKALFKRAGVTLGPSTTWAKLAGVATSLKGKGITPLCLGDKDIWTAGQLLEEMIVGQVGASGWTGLLNGSVKWSSPQVAAVVGHFNTALGWTNSDHKSQDWAGAVGLLASGKCAMNVMGDWAYGELKVKWKQVDGKDFGYTIIGNPSTFVTVGDAFVVGKGSKNPAAAQAWAKAIMSPQAQLAFNRLKGSAPVRSDVNVSSYGPYQRGAAKVLAKGVKVPSLIHGQASVKASVGQAYSDAVTLLEANHDAGKFGTAMDAAIAAGK